MKEDLYDYLYGKRSYFSPEFLLKGIVCSTGGPQYSINDSCYIPMAELYPDEIDDDELNIKREENTEMENNIEISKEEQIKKLQQEYENLLSKLDQLKAELKEPNEKGRNILIEYGKIETELNYAIKDITKTQNDFSELKNKFRTNIIKRERNLIIKLLIVGAIIPTILTIISLLLKNPYLLNNPGITVGYLLGMPMVFGAINLLAYLPFREKYISKLEKEYMQNEDYQNFQRELDKKNKIKEEIEKKLNLKYQELEDNNKDRDKINYQINLTIQSIRKLKEQLTEIILPNSKNIEIAYLSANTAYQEINNSEQDKSILSRKLTKKETNNK